jgi:hypothetical protein
MDQTVKLLEDKFVDGLGIDEKGQKISLKATDIVDFPAHVVNGLIEWLVGALNPKS